MLRQVAGRRQRADAKGIPAVAGQSVPSQSSFQADPRTRELVCGPRQSGLACIGPVGRRYELAPTSLRHKTSRRRGLELASPGWENSSDPPPDNDTNLVAVGSVQPGMSDALTMDPH